MEKEPQTIASNPTAPVTNVNDAPTGEVSIDGIAREDETPEIVSTLADEDGPGTLSYSGWPMGVRFPATSSKLTLSQGSWQGDLCRGEHIDGGTAESVTSDLPSLFLS